MLGETIRTYDVDRLDNRDTRYMEWYASLFGPVLERYFSPVVRGLDRIPEGAGLYVGNHNSGQLSPDSFVFGYAVYRERGLDNVPYGLGHDVIVRMPVLQQIIVPLGAVRASHENAHRIFEMGMKVMVYPGSDLDNMRSFWNREQVVFGPRRGYIRLALTSGVPIIPVVAAGAHNTFFVAHDGQWLAKLLRMDRWLRCKVCPVTLSIPWGLTIGPPPTHFPLPTRIYIEVLDPVHFERQGPEAAEDSDYVDDCHQRVHSAMQAAMTRLSAERRADAKTRRRGWVRQLLGNG